MLATRRHLGFIDEARFTEELFHVSVYARVFRVDQKNIFGANDSDRCL